MCLEIKNVKKDKEGNIIPLIAKKDIICYKTLIKRPLDGVYETCCQNTEVKMRQVMKVKEFGYSYDDDVNEGIHVSTTKNAAKGWLDLADYDVVVQCTIPKGTPYHIGKSDDMVALKVKLGKIVYKDNKWIKN